MSYFVTGATGFIGRHLVARLLDRDALTPIALNPRQAGEFWRESCYHWSALMKYAG